ncbi:MAG: hypothetical protein A4E55_00567 [Pelotomaculum sp. PtaU1.Bin035]|nr:MAG: hypothetical protein A4E55_00567 [Pelotomaculum sp. PtaU1.Bin035]
MNTVNELKNAANIDKTSINIEDSMAVSKFARDLTTRMIRFGVSYECPKILLCIGTDRSTGDSLGPLVGSKINSVEQGFFNVYGTLEQPVHASNLKATIEEINNNYKEPFIIAIDACLGKIENVGCVNLGDGSLQPGAGVYKNLPPVGQIHITGIVNVGGFMEYLVLQNTRLNLVMRIADIIASGLNRTILEYSKQNAWRI